MDLNLKNKHPRRIYYLFLVIIFFLASTEIAYSQVKNLSLHLTNVTLEEALAQIKQKGEYSLWYRNEEINLKKKVSLDIKNGSITQILDALFKGEDLGYIIEDKHIVIFKADEKEYIALLPLDENGDNTDGQIYLYRFIDNGEEEEPGLENIEEDEEFDRVSAIFNEWLDTQDFGDIDLDALDDLED